MSANNNVISVPRISSSEMKVLELREEGIQVNPGDTVCILEANDVQKLYDKQFDGLQKLEADLVKMEVSNEVELSILNAQLEEFKAQKSLSKLDSLQLLFTTKEKSEIKILEEKINEIQQEKLIRKMEAQHMINEQSARALRSQIVQKKQTIQKYQDQLNQLVLTSPAKGILLHGSQPVSVVMSSNGEISRSGGGKIVEGVRVRQNMRIVELPDLDSMQITLMLQEAEYKRVKTGQSVIIRYGYFK